jgi:hypothetical protein
MILPMYKPIFVMKKVIENTLLKTFIILVSKDASGGYGMLMDQNRPKATGIH